MVNILEKLIILYPDLPWNWYCISSNKNVNIDWIKRHPTWNWKWGRNGLSTNSNFKLKWIDMYPDKSWEFGEGGLSENTNISIQWIIKYPKKPWNWFYISKNEGITYEFYEMFSDEKWSYNSFGLLVNPNLTIEWIQKYKNKPWEWQFMTSKKTVNPEWCTVFPKITNWGTGGFSSNPNLCLEWLKKYPKKPWDWFHSISENPNLELEWIETFPTKNWNWGSHGIWKYIKLTDEVFEKYYAVMVWGDYGIIYNQTLTLDIVKKWVIPYYIKLNQSIMLEYALNTIYTNSLWEKTRFNFVGFSSEFLKKFNIDVSFSDPNIRLDCIQQKLNNVKQKSFNHQKKLLADLSGNQFSSENAILKTKIKVLRKMKHINLPSQLKQLIYYFIFEQP